MIIDNIEQNDALYDTPICRYLSLNHFIDMMECHRLYVNRRKAFYDVNERYIPFHWSGYLMPVGENCLPQPDRASFGKIQEMNILVGQICPPFVGHLPHRRAI